MSDEMRAEYDIRGGIRGKYYDPELMASNLMWFEEAKKQALDAWDYEESYRAWRALAEKMDTHAIHDGAVAAALAREQHAKAIGINLDARLAEAYTLLNKYKDKYGAWNERP